MSSEITLTYTDIDYHGDNWWKEVGQMAAWAKANCQGTVTYETVDMSDVSLVCDGLAHFWFDREEDAILFKLRWGG